jgi:hypothetical protein
MSEQIVLQANDQATVVVLHRDGSMSTVAFEVDDLGTWGMIINPTPMVPYSIIEPCGCDDA